MEDGSALSPIIANQVAPHNQYSNSIQYLRILSKLCDCPTSNLHPSRVSESGGNFSPSDEAKTNNQMLDCLRYKPVDQVAQRVPLELLQLDPTSGDLVIQQKWLSKLRPILETPGPAAAATSVTSEHIAHILDFVAGQEAARGPTRGPSDMFEAIYGYTSQTGTASIIRPLFGPVLDGSIVPDEDFAIGALKDDSPLAQRDLLIGLTHPVLSGSEWATMGNGTATSLVADNYLLDRILVDQELQRFGNEQAINLVNAFVRSFYRYHNQEIANSILNHYLSLLVWHQQLSRQANNLRQTESRESLHHANDHTSSAQDEEESIIQRRRQEFLLGSISRLLQDSLIDVPLFKLALIHSIKQVDSLVGAFVQHSFEQWRIAQAGESRHQDHLPADWERKPLMEAFTAFARHSLDRQAGSGALKWRQLSREHQVGTRSTFFYRFETPASDFGLSVVAAVERILAKEKVIEQDNIWALIEPILRHLASKLKNVPAQRASLECAYYPTDLESSDGAGQESSDPIVTHLKQWFCLRLTSQALAGFVAAGDVNWPGDRSDESGSVSSISSLDRNLVSVESECLAHRSFEDHHLVQPTFNNSHLRSNHDKQLTSGCQEHLNNLALTIVTNELSRADENGTEAEWANFNIFSQQVATLTNQNPRRLWKMNQISELGTDPTGLVAKSSFWSNFVPALNCNKTQPVSPSTLLDGPFNSSLLNLNLQFTCQQGSKTAQDHLESMVTLIGQRLRALRGQWQQSHSSPSSSSIQNHHSLRMANMSQSSSVDDNMDSNDDHGFSGNQTNSSSANTLDLAPHTNTFGPSEARGSRVTGFTLILCALIVVITLVSGSYVAIKERRRSQANKSKRTSSAQVDSPAKLAEPPASNVVDLQLLDRSSDENQQISTTNNMVSCLDSESSLVAGADWTAARLDMNNFAQPSLPEDDMLGREHQFITSDLANQSHLSGMAQCRSHSAMSLAAQLPSIDNFAHSRVRDLRLDQAFDGYGLEFNMEEPIVLPILSSNQQQQDHWCQTLDARRHNYLTGIDNRSGVETLNGRSSQSSSSTLATKKRVKINEPQSIMKDRTRQSEDNFGRKSQHSKQQLVYHDKPRVQLCPIHSRSQSSQFLAAATAADVGYILNGTSQYMTMNNPGSWTSEQAATVGYNNTCDHHSTSVKAANKNIPDQRLG